VVSQPGKPKGRGNKAVPVPSPVEEVARRRGLPPDRILCPASAKDVRQPAGQQPWHNAMCSAPMCVLCGSGGLELAFVHGCHVLGRCHTVSTLPVVLMQHTNVLVVSSSGLITTAHKSHE
jgi:hypothetical protein